MRSSTNFQPSGFSPLINADKAYPLTSDIHETSSSAFERMSIISSLFKERWLPEVISSELHVLLSSFLADSSDLAESAPVTGGLFSIATESEFSSRFQIILSPARNFICSGILCTDVREAWREDRY